MTDTTLVVGATGNVGSQVVRRLLEEGRPVRALSRTPEAADLPSGAESVRGDLTDPASLDNALTGADAVFLVWPGVDTEHASAVAKLLASRRVVYLSSAGIDDSRPTQADPINQMHADVERALEGGSTDWTFLRCTSFAASLLEWGDQVREGVVREAFGQASRPLLHERDIADVAVRVLLDGTHQGERLFLSGPEPLTQVEQVRIIGAALGIPVRFEEVPLDDMRAHMREEGWAEADIEGMLTAYAAMSETEPPVWDTVERITGQAPRNLTQWVRDHEDSFR
ncbi:NAD(P)H-binding protein [Nocardiopsis exhalans]|uniref:NAD(P)H-binding protein n=1 Tax=Nocardiopsis exhalans TaxID=163604 RepID=A0ABY5DG44_9ACTN|nr:NAD(P)H-binding protein [Nocardiopsis exhalans]USY22920.1 NAD(P)H-binding protein [Nocardiopsis exhalans]